MKGTIAPMRTLNARLAMISLVLVGIGCSQSPIVDNDVPNPPADTFRPIDMPNVDVPNPPVDVPTDVRTCVAAMDCDDGIPCTEDICNPIGGCEHRARDMMCADDGIACTVEACILGRGCVSTPESNRCSNGQICRVTGGDADGGAPDAAAGGCTPPPSCNSPNDPRCDDGQPCTTDSCNMATGQCQYASDDMMCSDGQFCNGTERCVAFRGCVGGTPPRCDDGTVCTLDQCNEDMDRCENFAENRLCDDGIFCNGAEVCDPMMRGRGCVAAPAPRSCDDMNACTVDRCDEAGRQCRNTPRDVDMDGDPDLACGGGDCDDNNPRVNSRAVEVCNGIDDNCNGTIDEGVISACGNCDPTCRASQVGGMGGNPFSMSGSRGVANDPMAGGLIVQAQNRSGDFLWIPNTGESTVSKWDANMGVELGRYRVGLAAGECRGSCCHTGGCNMTSRVAVDGFGDLVVANRGFSMQGTVAKIAADRRDCVDRNMNGMIDTSTGPMNVLPFDQDECVLWNVPVGPVNAVLRMITVDRGDAMAPQGYVWVGSCSGGPPTELYRLDPRTGRVLNTVPITHCSYGGVVTADGTLHAFEGAYGSRVTSVNTSTRAIIVTRNVSTPGCSGGYGITGDPQGRLWTSYCGSGLGAYDPIMNTFSYANLGSSYGSGVTVDANGEIWSMRSDGADLAHFPSAAFAAGGQVPAAMIRHIPVPAANVSGSQSAIGADRSGRIWMTRIAAGPVVRYDPVMNTFTNFNGPNQVYTYTDFTGSVRRSVIGTGVHIEEFDGTCANPNWGQLAYDVVTPAGTSMVFSFQTADTFAGLGAATPVQIAMAPPDRTPADVAAALRAAMIAPRRHARVTVVFNPTNMPVQSPVLRSMRLQWNCP
jgi:streptogramin lyase